MPPSPIDLKKLRQAIRNMKRNQGIFKVLRDELRKLGYWHNLPRGNPSLGYKEMRKKQHLKSP